MLRPGAGPEPGVHFWHELFDQEGRIVGPQIPGRVFAAAFIGAPDAYDDDWRKHFGGTPAHHGFIHAPIDAGAREARVEKILTIVHVEHVVTVGRIGVVIGRQPDFDVASWGQVFRRYISPIFQPADNARTSPIIEVFGDALPECSNDDFDRLVRGYVQGAVRRHGA